MILNLVLDRQFEEIPKDVVYCKNCVTSNQRPRIGFNEEGVCSACQWAYEKDHLIDWELRQKEIEELCNKHRSKDGSFDVIVPGSGGKDSGFVAHQLKERYGMHPLCVTWAPNDWTDIGWKNLKNFVSSGFNNIIGQPDGQIHRKLCRLAFELLGDAWQPFGYGQKAWAFHIAEKFNVKLIFYGENGEVEYGGSTEYKYKPKEDPTVWKRHHFMGNTVDKLVEVGLERGIFHKKEINDKTMQWYKPPSFESIEEKGIEMHWYSYYEKWTPQENFYYCVKHTGFETNDEGRTESTYTKYASIDDKLDGFHFYLGYMKFGMGRATRDASQDIRRHHITREEGVSLVKRYDNEFPQKHFSWTLNYLNIDEAHFWEVMDFWRQQSNIWKKKNGKWELKTIVS